MLAMKLTIGYVIMFLCYSVSFAIFNSRIVTSVPFPTAVFASVTHFWTRKAGPKTLFCDLLLVLGISSRKIPKVFLIRSGVQRNFAYTFPTDLPSQILKFVSN